MLRYVAMCFCFAFAVSCVGPTALGGCVSGFALVGSGGSFGWQCRWWLLSGDESVPYNTGVRQICGRDLD